MAVVLDGLAAEGLLSDARFTAEYIHSRAGKGFGPERIRQELKQRGVEAEVAAARMRDAGTDWTELGREVCRRRFGRLQAIDDGERAKQARFLLYRGFTGEQIHAILDVETEA